MLFMPNIMIPKNDIMLSSAKDVETICTPLHNLGITYFSYVRIYNDGSRFDINNNADFSEAYYYKSNCYQLYAPEMNPRAFKNGFLFASPNFVDQCENLREISHSFSAANIIVFIKKQSNYCDLWHFGSPPNAHDMINTYLSNLDVLKLFRFYFEDKGAPLIKQFEANRLVTNKEPILTTSNNLTLSSNKTLANNKYLNTLRIDRYQLGEDYNYQHLTKREVECIKWCIKGKTAKETALILNITKRTVNAHLENAKQKLNCYKQSVLIYRAIDLGIVDVL
jgi:LuxR family transcriptional regulator